MIAMLCLAASAAAADDAKPPVARDTKPLSHDPRLGPISNDTMMMGFDDTALAAMMGADNAAPGPRTVPGRAIPVPTTTSPEFRAQVAAPYRTPDWDADPKTKEDWKRLIAELAAKGAAKLPALREKLGVTSEPITIGGVKAFRVAAKTIPDAHKGQIILAIHGGGYVYNPGEAGTLEAVLMAGFGGYTVIAVDYRMPPDFPFPAATDDVMAAYKALLRDHKADTIGVVGTSAGGGLTLALCLRARAEGVPLPGAIAPGTPEADMTNAGDTLATNEWLDNVLVSTKGYVAGATKLYVPAGHDLKDPQLSPIYGDFKGLPPAIITSGTRDLFLSNAVRVHRKLRQAGIEAILQVYEGMSHAQYLFNADAPETKEAFGEIAGFFDKHLAR
jgi:acetyl esterase/lipase